MTRRYISNWVAGTIAIFLAVGLVRCSLDVENPNSATQQKVESSPPGVMGLAVGLQQFYSTAVLQARVLYPGLTSKEVAVNRTFSDLIELEKGGTGVSDANSDILTLWANCLKTVSMADELLASVQNVTLAAGTKSGIQTLAYLFKAMALGALAESFAAAPIATSQTSRPVFHPRQEVLAEALRLLGLAAQTLQATPVSPEFSAQVLGAGMDLRNTISAYQARFNLMAGNYAEAIAAANQTSPTVVSRFVYDDKSRNPIYDALTSLGRWAPIDLFGFTETDTTDQRLAFYMTRSGKVSDPSKIPIGTLKGFFDNATKPIPVYLPSEMILIRAEADVRLGDLSGAVSEINAIRTKTPAQDPLGVGAGLPPYSGPTDAQSLLDEIYRQRCAELFWSGVRWEDSRRLGRPGPLSANPERSRDFYPYPAQERVNNPNTPPDPAI